MSVVTLMQEMLDCFPDSLYMKKNGGGGWDCMSDEGQEYIKSVRNKANDLIRRVRQERKGRCEMSCRICQSKVDEDSYAFIELPVNGSEGLWVCEQCKMIIIEHIRNMEHVAARARTQMALTIKRDREKAVRDDNPRRSFKIHVR